MESNDINNGNNNINNLNLKIETMEKDINSLKNYINSLNAKIEKLEKESSTKNDIIEINSKIESIEKKLTDKNENTTETQPKVENTENEKINNSSNNSDIEKIVNENINKNNNIIELKNKIENIDNYNINNDTNINNINNKIKELENNEVDTLKYSILSKIRSKTHEYYLTIKLKNRGLKMHFFRTKYENEINQLLNANKIIHFRKFVNILYDEIDKKIGRKKRLSKESFRNVLNPNGKSFPIIYVDEDIEGVKASKITAIIDYFNFVKEECSNIIHLKKEHFIKEDIYLNHLIMEENKYNNFEKEYMKKIKEISEKSNNENNKNENNLNNINIEEEKKDNNDEQKKYYSLKELCTFLFAKEKLDDYKLFKKEIMDSLKKMDLISKSDFSLMSMNDFSSTKISDTNISNTENNPDNEKSKIYIEKFFNDKKEILYDELEKLFKQNNDELINKKLAFNSEKIKNDLDILQTKIKIETEKQKKYKELKRLLKKEIIQKVNSNYFFEEYKNSFSIENYREYVHKFNIKNIKEIKEKHYRLQNNFYKIVNKNEFNTLEEMNNEILKLIDGNKLINIFEIDPGDFISVKTNNEKNFPDEPSKPIFFNSKKKH